MEFATEGEVGIVCRSTLGNQDHVSTREERGPSVHILGSKGLISPRGCPLGSQRAEAGCQSLAVSFEVNQTGSA